MKRLCRIHCDDSITAQWIEGCPPSNVLIDIDAPHGVKRLRSPRIGASGLERVIIVSNLFPPFVIGGAEIVAHRQARALFAEGLAVAVFAGAIPSMEHPPGHLKLETGEGFPVYRIGLTSLNVSDNFHLPSVERVFRALLAAHRPDIVHFHNVTGLGYNLILAAKATGARVIVTLHDHNGFCFKNTLLRSDGGACDNHEECALCQPAISIENTHSVPIRMRRDFVAWCVDQADLLISPSSYMAGAYSRSEVIRATVKHLSNGIPLETTPVTPLPHLIPINFCCFSYLGEHKGIATLLDSAAILAKDSSLDGRWSLTIAGDGHMAEGLIQDIASNRFGSSVKYNGRLDHADALAVLERSHVVVLASHWPENEPVSLLEAAASGRAQIATRIGGNVELVDDKLSGLLVRPGDAADLAAAMRRFVEDPSLVVRFGNYNSQRRSCFDEKATLERLIKLYRTPLQHARPSDDLVVICSGTAPSPVFAEHLRMLMHRFHIVEEKQVRRIRFIWHTWAGGEAWRQARLLWVLGETDAHTHSLISRALRARIPVLVPDESSLADAVQHGCAVSAYSSLLDALGAVAAIQDTDTIGGGLASNGPRTARLLTALTPQDHFHLSSVGPT
nr:glycosyltransferase [Methylobacterium sp. GXS13]